MLQNSKRKFSKIQDDGLEGKKTFYVGPEADGYIC